MIGRAAIVLTLLAGAAFAQDVTTETLDATPETEVIPFSTTESTLPAPQVQRDAAASAGQGEVRVLDKITGKVSDLTLAAGETTTLGHLTITLNDCRYPTDNPSGDAYGSLSVTYRDDPAPVFQGWMVASAPALNAMDHPRYDVWMLRCITD